MRTALNRK